MQKFMGQIEPLWSADSAFGRLLFLTFKRNGFLKGSGLLQVTFATFESEKDAVDLGGPRREFFHLLSGPIARESGTVTSKIFPECFYF